MIYYLNKKNESIDSLGGKASNLIKLHENQFNVPNFIVFSNNFFLNLFESYLIDFNVSNFFLKKEDYNTIFLKLVSSKEIKNSINKEIKFNNDLKFAVRSSGNLEDSSLSSFAGIFDSYLNVGEENLQEKVIECWFSIFKKPVINYLKSRNLSFKDLKMNVIVQQMIDSDFSGIIFTKNPIIGTNDIIIEIAKGLGDEIVSGNIIPYTYTINRNDKKITLLTNNVGKDSGIIKKFIPELFKLALSIEKCFYCNADIEFAIKNNVIYILQVRPITTNNELKL